MDNLGKISNLKRDDIAFFNSILSYGIYTDREWMLGLNEFGENGKAKSFDEAIEEAAFALTEIDAEPKEIMKRNYELYLSAYINDNFEKFSLNHDEEFEFCSVEYEYSTKCQFRESDYITLNNLARAGYFLSTNEDGSKNLHLVFRGTDNKARDFMEFVGKAYLDMSAYYSAFKPLEDKILAFAKDPKNNIKSVHVSGHSLGGAMVQEFFNSEAVKDSGLNLIGFTYGAPGSDKKPIYTVLTETFHTVKKVVKNGNWKAFGNLALNTLAPIFTPSFIQNLGVSSIGTLIPIQLDFQNDTASKNPQNIDHKIHQYEHTGDLIPKIGGAVYNETGNEIYLKDVASKNAKETFMLTGLKEKEPKHKFFSFLSASFNFLVKKPIRFIKNMFQFQYHDMMRYVVNIEHKIVSEKSQDYKETPYYNEFKEYKQRFFQTTSDKNEDLIYQRMLEKQKIPDNAKKSIYIKLPKEIEKEMLKYRNYQTSKNVVSDILGKPYVMKSTRISGTSVDIDTTIPNYSHESSKLHLNDVVKNFTVATDGVYLKEQPELPVKNIKLLREKFLTNPSSSNKLEP